MRFIHAADIHLDSPLVGLERYEGAPVKEIRGATRRALERLVDLSILEDVSFVLIAGDLYDGDWRDFNTGLFFVKQMARLRDAGICALLVSGNHDAQARMTQVLNLPDNVTVFPTDGPGSKALDAFGVVVHGQSFAEKAVMENLSSNFPDPVGGVVNIGLLHTNVDGQVGHDNYAPCSLQELRSKGYEYWALGHVHTGAILSEDPWVVYPGNIQGRHIRELGPKGCRVVEVADGQVTQCEHRDLDVIRWQECKVDINADDSADDVVVAIVGEVKMLFEKNGDRMLAIRVEANGATSAHDDLMRLPEKWEAEIRAGVLAACSSRVWVERIRFQTRPTRGLVVGGEADFPLGRLLEGLGAPAGDDSYISHLSTLFSDIDVRLPVELKKGPDGLSFTETAIMSQALNDARSMLLSRIARGGTE